MDPTKSPTQRPTQQPTIDEDLVLEAYKLKQTNLAIPPSIMIDLYQIKPGTRVFFEAFTKRIYKEAKYDLIITKYALNETKIVAYHENIDVIYDDLIKMCKALAFDDMTIQKVELITKTIRALDECCIKADLQPSGIPFNLRNVICRALFAKNQTAANMEAFKIFIQVFAHAHDIKTKRIRECVRGSDEMEIDWRASSKVLDKIFAAMLWAIKTERGDICKVLVTELQHSMMRTIDLKHFATIIEILGAEMDTRNSKICIIVPACALGGRLRGFIHSEMPYASTSMHLAVGNDPKRKFRVTRTS